MTCKIIIQLVGISHAGSDIGDDWTYDVQVQGQRRRRINGQGWGRPGRRYPVFRQWTFYGDCGVPNSFRASAQMNEEDFIWDDTGTGSGTLVINCPAFAGVIQPSNGHQATGNVPESFGFLGTGGTNTVTFHFNATAQCL